jgi:hypothetical protein
LSRQAAYCLVLSHIHRRFLASCSINYLAFRPVLHAREIFSPYYSDTSNIELDPAPPHHGKFFQPMQLLQVLSEVAATTMTTLTTCSFVLVKIVENFPRSCRDQATFKDIDRALLFRRCLVETVLDDMAQSVRQAEKARERLRYSDAV